MEDGHISADFAILTCGYEERASFLAQSYIPNDVKLIVLDYECGGTFSYESNRSYFESRSAKFISLSDDGFTKSLKEEVLSVISAVDHEQSPEVVFDVSSCSRSVMAATLVVLSDLGIGALKLKCAYALSRFDEAPTGELPSNVSEPVIGELSGWSDDLSKPPCAIISLGFEPGRALGSIDYLEVPTVRLFMPRGPDERFGEAVDAANRLLIDEAGNDFVFPYDVMQPNSTYAKLESLVSGLLEEFRPVIIPLGPKIFSAISMVLAIKLFPRVCVWRTSAGTGEEMSDTVASGDVSIFSTIIRT